MPHPKTGRTGHGDAPREIELKLDLAPDDADRLAAELTTRFGPPREAALRSTYHDTPDLALASAGISLRLRHDGNRLVQTVKAGGETGPFDRREWEREVAGPDLDFEAAEGTAAAPLLARKRVRRHLEPVFTVAVRRLTWTVGGDADLVELALDRGAVEAHPDSEPVCELELELKRGEPARLFAMAADLSAIVPLRLGVRTKSTRGFDLVGGGLPPVCRAEPVPLTTAMTAADAFRAIAHACLRHFRLNEAGVVERGQVEALHQARVAMRRLRSALSLFRPMLADPLLPETAADDLRGRLRAASQLLGEARNIDVFLAGALEDHVEERPFDPGVSGGSGSLIALAERRREEAYEAVRALLDSAPFRTLMLDVAAWIETGDWTRLDATAAWRERPAGDAAAAILDRRRRVVLRRARDLGTLSVEERHRVRIAVKKLRYAADFFAPLHADAGRHGRRQQDRFGEALADLQEALGALNDIAAAGELARAIAASDETEAPQAAFAAGELSAAQQARIAALLGEAADAVERLADVKPYWR